MYLKKLHARNQDFQTFHLIYLEYPSYAYTTFQLTSKIGYVDSGSYKQLINTSISWQHENEVDNVLYHFVLKPHKLPNDMIVHIRTKREPSK